MGSRLETNSTNVRKRIESHTFESEDGEEYEASTFGGFGDYMRRKKLKLQNLDAEIRANSKGNPPIFRGVVAHVNGYTQPSLSDLHALIVGYGGGFSQYLDGKTAVTHIIASNLTPKKKEEFKRYRIVSPQWIVDSVRAGKLQPWDQYRVVDEGVTQKVLHFDNGQMVSQTNIQTQGYREQSDSSWYASQFKKTGTETSHTALPSIMIPSAKQEQDMSMLKPSGVSLDDSFGASGYDDIFQSSELHLATPDSAAVSIGDQMPGDDARAESRIGFSSRAMQPNHPLATDDNTADHEKQRDDDSDFRQTSPAFADAKPFQPANEHRKSAQKNTLTAEEHNAKLLEDPHMLKSSAVNPDFLRQYYKESRLHHLSTWKAELKAQLQAITQERTVARGGRQKLTPGARRYIMHVDFDCFFAAVSLHKRPEFTDKPVVVAHGTGPGSEIASCSYAARKFGVKNGMWMKSALQMCPDLKVLPYEYEDYEEASRQFYEAIMATEGIVQSVSIDEALVDITSQVLPAGGSDGKGISEGSMYREQAKADEIGRKVREEIKEKTGCDVSVGIGNNILLAKVALRKAKPAGQHQIKPEEVLEFLADLAVQDLPGVAYSIGGKLEEIGVKYVKDIRCLTKERLINALGPKTGEKIWDYSRGIDRTEVGEQTIRKSVSAEVNWGIRFITQAQADEFVQSLCDELHRRLLENSVKGRQLTMKIMRRSADAPLDPLKHLGHGKCDTFNKSIVLNVATNDQAVIGREALSILKGFGFSPGELRGLGVQMTKLEPMKQLPGSLVDSSQKRLQFKQTSPTARDSQNLPPLIPRNAEKSPGSQAGLQLKQTDGTPKRPTDLYDPIEDIKTPEKPKVPSSSVYAGMPKGESADKLLNVMGTQFILPSQIDPTVLAELPTDIRLKLTSKKTAMDDSKASIQNFMSASTDRQRQSRSHSPLELPNPSEIDPETFAALPDDLQAELRAYYAQSASPKRAQAQQLLPQSPRKNRTIPAKSTSKRTTPSKRKAGSSLLGRSRASKSSGASSSTLTQSAFVTTRPSSNVATVNSSTGNVSDRPSTPPPNPSDPADSSVNEISPSFLAALPPDIRAELLAQQRQERLRAKSNLAVSSKPRARQRVGASGRTEDALAGNGQRTIKLPPRCPIPTFTSRKLWRIEDVRRAIRDWVEMFSEPIKSNRDAEEDSERATGWDMGVRDGFDDDDHDNSNMYDDDDDDDDHDNGEKENRLLRNISSPTPRLEAKSGAQKHRGEVAELQLPQKEKEPEGYGEDPGPYPEDITSLRTYLSLIITQELNLSKAVDLVKWLVWCIDDLIPVSVHDQDPGKSGTKQEKESRALRERWDGAIRELKDGVVQAANQKGVRGDVAFD